MRRSTRLPTWWGALLGRGGGGLLGLAGARSRSGAVDAVLWYLSSASKGSKAKLVLLEYSFHAPAAGISCSCRAASLCVHSVPKYRLK